MTEQTAVQKPKKSKYDRDVIIKKLERKGLKIKRAGKVISHMECPPNVDIGIKLLGYIDFLKIPIKKLGLKPKKKKDKPKQLTIQYKDKLWKFSWHCERAEAEAWVQKEIETMRENVKIEKTEIHQTELLDYRVTMQGIFL